MKKEQQKAMDYIFTAAGILLLGLGLYFVGSSMELQGFMRVFPYVCIGLGCGVFGHGMGNIISDKKNRKDPAREKLLEIEKADERNIAITNRAKAKAYNLMLFVFSALMIAFALMGVDIAAVLLFVAAYLFVQGYAIYYRCRYEKEM